MAQPFAAQARRPEFGPEKPRKTPGGCGDTPVILGLEDGNGEVPGASWLVRLEKSMSFGVLIERPCLKIRWKRN